MWLWTRLDVLEPRAGHRHELEVDRQKMLADDVKARSREQMMDVGDAAGHRILDRDHGQVGLAPLDRGEAVLEGRAGHCLVVGMDLLAGEVELAPGSPWNTIFLRRGMAFAGYGVD